MYLCAKEGTAMPSIYTHHCFGKEVLKCLPEDLSEICKKYKNAFRFGVQGQDFVFLFLPFLKLKTNRLGYKMHRTPAKDIIRPLIPLLKETGINSEEYAYLIGFICHFMLDSECHGYVNQKAKEKGYNHLVMEMEFDRYLLNKNKKNAIHFPIYRLIPHDPNTIKALAHVYAQFGASERQIAEALKGMYFYKKLFTTGKTLQRAIIRLGMKITLHYKQLEGHMMDLIPKKSSAVTNQALSMLYQNAIEKTADIIKEFHIHFPDGKPLNERFSCDFKSNRIPDS